MKISMATALAIVIAMFGYHQFNLSTFALAEDLQEHKNLYEYKINTYDLRDVQQRMYVIDDRYYEKEMPVTVQEEMRELQEDAAEIKETLKRLKEK